MFVTMFDEAYCPWGILLLRTLHRFHPELSVTVVGIELSERSRRQCRDANAKVLIVDEELRDPTPDRPTAIANTRPLWLQRILQDLDPDWALFLDADLILRHSTDALLLEVQQADAALVVRDGHFRGQVRRRLRVAAGLIFIRRSGRALITRWCQLLQRQEPIEDVVPRAWFWEQTCLVDAVEISPELRIASLESPRHLSAPPFADDALFWSANVKSPEKPAIFDIFSKQVAALSA